jgi:hypothetical protein
MKAGPINRAPALAIYAGRQFLGFLRELGGGEFEALDCDRRSLGTFASRTAAADVVEAAAQGRE